MSDAFLVMGPSSGACGCDLFFFFSNQSVDPAAPSRGYADERATNAAFATQYAGSGEYSGGASSLASLAGTAAAAAPSAWGALLVYGAAAP